MPGELNQMRSKPFLKTGKYKVVLDNTAKDPVEIVSFYYFNRPKAK